MEGSGRSRWGDLLTVEEGSPLGARTPGNDLSLFWASCVALIPWESLCASAFFQKGTLQPFLCQLL